jgi:drug/metabolite transporter (DMT)-like permease
MVKLFSYKNFAVTINFTKSDNLFAAFFGVILFSEFLNWIGWLAIGLSVFGILLVNYQKNEAKKIYKSLGNKSALLGLGSGALFALSSFFVKFANSSYLGGSILANSALTLILVLVIQTILLSGYLMRFRKSEILEIPRHWKSDFAIGTTSSLASIFWFLSFSLAPVALVRTVGQIEMVLTLILTHRYFKEKLKITETIGISLTLLGIIILALSI